ncbi:MAG TPA: hypothetical protein PLU91_05575 [Verrucomicrobiota bacterium]|nr:hypothetical protein [Verrucomicrobiota bacterium]
MIRIPNPGSDIDIFIRIFRELHAELHSHYDFNLDDMTRAMIIRNNVTSQGAIGQEALRRSTREDRSRDPLYNQSKMYAELFRTLGWLQSTSSALRFAFSFLGHHVASAKTPKPLAKECLLGLAYPNDVLEVKGRQSIRIFTAILRAMARMGNRISRDEMIAGPMSIDNDRDETLFAEMVEAITDYREEPGALQIAIKQMEKDRAITKTTMENYTRFPIAALQWAGWAQKDKGYLHLTPVGLEEVARIQGATDVRLSDFRKLPVEAQAPFVRYTFYGMLARSGFDVAPVAPQMQADAQVLAKHSSYHQGQVIFSPFQQIGRTEVNAAVQTAEAVSDEKPDKAAAPGKRSTAAASLREDRPVTRVLFEVTAEKATSITEAPTLAHQIRTQAKLYQNNINAVVQALATQHETDNQDVFYPLIAELFCLLGFNCQKSRQGVNYARADAIIIDPKESIPIEIKSPGEEFEISVKGVRQALENKVILLSRKNYSTTSETTSLVVGFNRPNERSEVHELIEDIHKAFGVRVAVLDFRSLLRLAVTTVLSEKKVAIPNFGKLKGVIDVTSA